MKNIFTKLFLLITVFSLRVETMHAQNMQRAGYAQTKLSISVYNNTSLRIIVDGNTYNYDNNRGDADFTLSNLSPGNHNVKIYRMPVRGRRGTFSSNAIPVLYDANVYLRTQYQTDIMINRFNHIFKDEALISDYGNTTNSPSQQYPQSNVQMSTEHFEELKETLRNESFDNSRITIAKQAAAANYFSAAQVKQLMLLFSYDDSRLEIAKAFYSRTTDKQNYFTVNDAFTYSTSKESLADYIKQNP